MTDPRARLEQLKATMPERVARVLTDADRLLAADQRAEALARAQAARSAPADQST